MTPPPLIDARIGDRVPGGLSIDELDAPWADRIGAVIDDAWARNPVPTIQRFIERRTAGNARLGTRRQGRVHDRRPYAAPLRSPEDLNERYFDLGLRFESPTRETVAILRADTRRRELARQAVIARGESGLGFTLESFGVGLLASAADPINIASAFVPIVGPVRFAAMTARSGIHAARLARGTVEGVVGAALVEPIVLAGAYAEDADYGVADSLLNLAFGGVLGGGLHVAGGRLGDAVSRGGGGRSVQRRLAAAAQETREAALRAAVAQAADGRKVDIEPIVNADPRASAAPREATGAPPVEGVPLAAEQYRAILQAGAEPGEFLIPEGFRARPDQLARARDIKRGQPQAKDRPESLARWIRSEGGIRTGDEAEELFRHAEIDPRSGLLRKKGRHWDDLAIKAQEEGFFRPPGPNEPWGLHLSEFFDAVQRDYQDAPGTVTRSSEDVAFREFEESLAEQHAYYAETLGLDLKSMSDRDLAWLMTVDDSDVRLHDLTRRVGSLSEVESDELAFRMDGEIEEAKAADIAAFRAETEGRAQALEPEEIDPELEAERAGRPVTLEELEAIDADYRGAVAAGRADRLDAGPDGPVERGAEAPAARAPGDPVAAGPAPEAPGAGPQGLAQYADRQDSPDADAIADPVAAREGEALFGRAEPTPEELDEAADFALEALDMDADELAGLQLADAWVEGSEDFGKAVQALATCRAA